MKMITRSAASSYTASLAIASLLFTHGETGAVELHTNALLNTIQVDEIPLDAPPASATAGFDIVLSYSNTPTSSQQAAFEAAEAAWESRIVGYQDTVSGNTLTINVNLQPIDGAGGTLGSAGPTTAKTGLENNFLYTSSGSMTFDTADTDNLELAGIFGDVIEHEMGHVLGLGTLWSSSGVGISGYQELYVNGSGEYTGASALAQWQTEFGQTGAAFVPVELGGGPGTANGHWNEVDGGGGLTGITQAGTGNDMRDELMTGWLGGSTFVSNMTLAQFEDLGYQVVIPSTVPEPSSLVLSVLGLSFLLTRKKR